MFSAYFSSASRLVYGLLSRYCSLAEMTRRNHALLIRAVPLVRADKSSRTWDRRIETGCLGGEPEKTRVMLSRQNWRRMVAIVGVEVVSAMRAISRLKARMER